MKLEPFSPKQLHAMCWWYPGSPDAGRDAIICDGAVRSGKTLCLGIGFAAWASRSFHGQAFAFCGRTIRSLKRNLLATLLPALQQAGFGCSVCRSENWMELSYAGHKNRFYFFGGKDESSAALIQGMTLAGVLLDEVALMPRSFVEQALARCSTKGSKFWFNCNPENPQHWFYLEWILKAKQKNALYLHFTMSDNPALQPEIIARYEQLYSGAFYERFIQGRWVAAQGLVYPFLTRAMLCDVPAELEEFRVSCDYGTVNPASFGLWGRSHGVWYRIDEYYYDSRREGLQRTDEEHYIALTKLCGERRIESVVVDPSAASFMETVRRHGKYRIIPAENEVLDGIRRVSVALKQGDIKICMNCADTIREFGLYRWADTVGKDIPLKENDHAMDDIRYFVASLQRETDDFCAVSVARREE